MKPGVYKHTITGLTPNTTYKVTVRAKNIKASPFVDEKSLARLLEKLSAHTEFRTLNKGKTSLIVPHSPCHVSDFLKLFLITKGPCTNNV